MDVIINDCIRCAERRIIGQLLRKSVKCGIKIYNFPTWLHRKHGKLIIWRKRKDGVMGNALPCVLCRKSLEKYKIQWVACVGDENWVDSVQTDNLPKSKSTHKQRRMMNFKK